MGIIPIFPNLISTVCSLQYSWMGWVLCCSSPFASCLGLPISGAMVLLQHAFLNVLLQSPVSSRHYNYLTPHTSACWMALEPITVRLFITSSVLPATLPQLIHIEPLMLFCCPSHKGLNAVAPQGASLTLLITQS